MTIALLTVAEVAATLRVSRMTIYRLVRAGELPTIRIGRSFRIPAYACAQYVEATTDGFNDLTPLHEEGPIVAQQVKVTLLDDLDQKQHGKDTPADGTVRFALDGNNYEIDLSDSNANRLRNALDPFLTAARRANAAYGAPHRPRRGRPLGPQGNMVHSREEGAAIREWATANGYPVADRGRIPGDIITAYRNRDKAATNGHAAQIPAQQASEPSAVAPPEFAEPAPPAPAEPRVFANDKEYRAAIREWAREHGYKAPPKGKIPEETVKVYVHKHGEPKFTASV